MEYIFCEPDFPVNWKELWWPRALQLGRWYCRQHWPSHALPGLNKNWSTDTSCILSGLVLASWWKADDAGAPGTPRLCGGNALVPIHRRRWCMTRMPIYWWLCVIYEILQRGLWSQGRSEMLLVYCWRLRKKLLLCKLHSILSKLQEIHRVNGGIASQI